MARILRRRVVQMPKVASGRRNLASEINQWLKLGHNAQQIIEKMIPDDPTMSKSQMHELIRARFAGLDRAPGVGAQYLEKAVTGDMNRTGAPAVTAPASGRDFIDEYSAAQGRLKGKVPTSSASAAAGDSSLTSAAPPRTPPTPMGEAAPLKREQLPPRPTGRELEWLQRTSPVSDLANQAARILVTTSDPTTSPEFMDLRDKVAIGLEEQFPNGSEDMYGDADSFIAEVAQKLRAGSVALPPPEPASGPTATAQAVASDAIKELAVDAPKAAQTVDEVIAMYDRLVEASGPRGFFENLGFGMADRMDAVNKAFMVNLSKSPLAQKNNGANLRAAANLLTQRMANERSQAAAQRKVDAATAAAKAKAQELAIKNQQDKDKRSARTKRDKKLIAARRSLARLKDKLKGKSGRVPVQVSSAIKAVASADAKYMGAKEEYESLKNQYGDAYTEAKKERDAGNFVIQAQQDILNAVSDAQVKMDGARGKYAATLRRGNDVIRSYNARAEDTLELFEVLEDGATPKKRQLPADVQRQLDNAARGMGAAQQ